MPRYRSPMEKVVECDTCSAWCTPRIKCTPKVPGSNIDSYPGAAVHVLLPVGWAQLDDRILCPRCLSRKMGR